MSGGMFGMLRDLYAASGGVVPGPAWTATIAVLSWVIAHHGVARGRPAHDSGEPEAVEDEFRETLARELGWTRAQLEEFWNNPRHDFGPDDARRFDETRDAWDRMIRMRRER